MDTPHVNIHGRQRHIAETAACFSAFSERLRLELVVAFSCDEATAQEVTEETFVLMYEQLEAGVTISCPPVWLYSTSTRLMRQRRTLLARLGWRAGRRLGWGDVEWTWPGIARLGRLTRRFRRRVAQARRRLGNLLASHLQPPVG